MPRWIEGNSVCVCEQEERENCGNSTDRRSYPTPTHVTIGDVMQKRYVWEMKSGTLNH